MKVKEENSVALIQACSRRVEWVDVLRVLAMLIIIHSHIFPWVEYAVWNILRNAFGVPVGYFFFISATLSKGDYRAMVKRSGLIYVSFVLWVLLSVLVAPLLAAWANSIDGGSLPISYPSWWELVCKIEPGYNVMFVSGRLWFLRALALYTLLTPLFFRIPMRWLCLLWGALYAWQLSALWIPGDDSSLVFFLQRGREADSLLMYLAGIFVARFGGIRALTAVFQRIPWCVPVAVIVASVSRPYLDHGTWLYRFLETPAVDLFTELAAFLALGLLIHKVSQCLGNASLYHKAVHAIAYMAPGVFFVYAAHLIYPPVMACFHVLEAKVSFPVFKVVMTFAPLVIFAVCYLMYLPLSRIPVVSRLLCFVPAPKRGKVSTGV